MGDMSKRALRIIIGDRTVAYHPYMAKVMGKNAAYGIWMSQLLYWDSVKAMECDDKGIEFDGWFFKTDAEIVGETCVSVREARGAKTLAKKLQVVDTEIRGMPARTFYRINFERIAELVDQVCTASSCQSVQRRTSKTVQSHAQNLPQSTSKITSKSTVSAEKPSAQPADETISHKQPVINGKLETNPDSISGLVGDCYATDKRSASVAIAPAPVVAYLLSTDDMTPPAHDTVAEQGGDDFSDIENAPPPERTKRTRAERIADVRKAAETFERTGGNAAVADARKGTKADEQRAISELAARLVGVLHQADVPLTSVPSSERTTARTLAKMKLDDVRNGVMTLDAIGVALAHYRNGGYESLAPKLEKKKKNPDKLWVIVDELDAAITKTVAQEQTMRYTYDSNGNRVPASA